MAENKRVDLTKIDGMGNGITTNDLQRQAIKNALAEELKDRRVLSDEAIAMIDEDERKITELERLAKEKGFVNAYGNNDIKLSDGNPSDIAITITADVDEAVTGLKRLQRELRKTAQELRELESAYKGVEEAIESAVLQFNEDGSMTMVGAHISSTQELERGLELSAKLARRGKA